MKLGCSTYSFLRPLRAGELTLPELFQVVAEAGGEGIELLDVLPHEPEEIVKAQDQTGISICVFSVTNDFVGDYETGMNKVRHGIAMCELFGAKILRTFAGNVPADGTPDMFSEYQEQIIRGLVETCQLAKDAGIHVALENHGRLAGKASQVSFLLSETNNRLGFTGITANPDFGNFLLTDEDPVEAVRSVGLGAVMAHIKDFADTDSEAVFTTDSGRKLNGAVVGEGAVDQVGCLLALKAHGFDGWVNLEYECTEDPMTGLPRALRNAKKLILEHQ